VLLILLNIKKNNTERGIKFDFNDVFRQIEDVNQRRKLNQNNDFIKDLKINKINTVNFTINNNNN